MAKNKDKIPFDEVYEHGPLQFGRAGRFTVFQNRMDESQFEEWQNHLSSQYPVVVEEINNLALEIRELISKENPLHLLDCCYQHYFMAHAGKKSEIELEHEDNLTVRALEYVQSVIASTPISTEDKPKLTTENWNAIFEKIGKFYTAILSSYFICQSAYKKKNIHSFDSSIESLFVQLQMHWMAVRSDRHHINEIPHLRDLLTPHDDIFQKIYGINIETFLQGLATIQHNLSRGIADNFVKIEQARDTFFEELSKLGEEEQNNILDNDAKRAEFLEKAGLMDGMGEALNNLFNQGIFNVKEITGWPDDLIRDLSWEIGEEQDFFANGAFCGWPLRVLPIFKRPFIIIDGISYCFDAINVFDHIYRQVETVICQKDVSYSKKWNEKQKQVSELLPPQFLGSILKGAELHNNIFYKDGKDWLELDSVIPYGDVLFVVEVKAGAFAKGPPSSNIPDYLNNIKKLITKPARQAHRFLSTLDEKGEVQLYDNKRRPLNVINRSNFRLCAPVCVTLDNITHIAARASTMGDIDPKMEEYPVWSLSLDDLRVFEKIFRHANIFCHFVEQRMKAVTQKAIPVFDEMDHVGLYFRENLYVDFFSNEFTYSMGEGTKSANMRGWLGYSSPIDEYFFFLDQEPDREPPQQEMPEKFKELIHALNKELSPENLYASRLLLNLSSDLRGDIAKGLVDVFEETLNKGRTITLHTFSPEAGFTFVIRTKNINYDKERLFDEAKAELVRQQPGLRVLFDIQADDEGKLTTCSATLFKRDDLQGEELKKAQSLSDKQAKRRISNAGSKKTGRNKPCPCGSGKKYKKCCLQRMKPQSR